MASWTPPCGCSHSNLPRKLKHCRLLKVERDDCDVLLVRVVGSFEVVIRREYSRLELKSCCC